MAFSVYLHVFGHLYMYLFNRLYIYLHIYAFTYLFISTFIYLFFLLSCLVLHIRNVQKSKYILDAYK